MQHRMKTDPNMETSTASQVMIDFVEACDYDVFCPAAKVPDTALIAAVNQPSSGNALNFSLLFMPILGENIPLHATTIIFNCRVAGGSNRVFERVVRAAGRSSQPCD